MKKQNYFWMAPLALAMVACNDDVIEDSVINRDSAPVREESTSVLADDVKVYPLLYNNFKNVNDVEILSADTTSMQVSSALLDAMQVDLEPGNVISVWTSPDDIPFMRRVQEVSKQGSSYRLYTSGVGLDEVLKEAHLEFDSDVYTNADEMPRNLDGTINDRFYLSEHDGVYHPVALWYHTREEDSMLRHQKRLMTRAGVSSADEDVLSLGYDRDRTVIVEQMGRTRASIDMGVNFKAEVKPMTRPIVVDEDTIATIGLQKANFEFKGGLHARLDCSFWNGVERFEVGPYYSLNGEVKAGVSMKSQLFKVKKEYTIAECQGFTSCFWVGPVPIVVNFTPSLVFSAELKGTAQGAIGAEFKFSGSHHTYACYDYRRDWYIDEGGEDFNYQVTPYAGGTFALDFQTGVYAKAAISLYGIAGPTISVGPSLKAKAEAKIDLVKAEADAKVSASMCLGGKVGAELKIWDWNLGKWECPFTLLEKELYSQSFNYKEWLEQIDKASEIVPAGKATDDWEAAKAEVEKEARYHEDMEEIFADSKTLQRFIYFMSPEFANNTDRWFIDKKEFVEDWQEIKDQHRTFYNWNLEFALWKCKTLEDFEMMQQICEHIDRDAQAKKEMLSKVSKAKVNQAFTFSVVDGVMSIVDALQKYAGVTDSAVVEDWENIRAERTKRIDFVRHYGGNIAEEQNRDYFTPWYSTFCGN